MFPVDPSPLLNSYESPTTDSPQLQLKNYKKKGYSVAISNGSLYEYTSEKGVVLMENGTTFAIAITNSNDYGEKCEILLEHLLPYQTGMFTPHCLFGKPLIYSYMTAHNALTKVTFKLYFCLDQRLMLRNFCICSNE